MWVLCGFMEKEDHRKIWKTAKVFDNFVVGSWDRKFFWKSVWCNTKKKGIVENVFLLVCYFNGKWLKHFHVFCLSLSY
jgi:hypothetical protein